MFIRNFCGCMTSKVIELFKDVECELLPHHVLEVHVAFYFSMKYSVVPLHTNSLIVGSSSLVFIGIKL